MNWKRCLLPTSTKAPWLNAVALYILELSTQTDAMRSRGIMMTAPLTKSIAQCCRQMSGPTNYMHTYKQAHQFQGTCPCQNLCHQYALIQGVTTSIFLCGQMTAPFPMKLVYSRHIRPVNFLWVLWQMTGHWANSRAPVWRLLLSM